LVALAAGGIAIRRQFASAYVADPDIDLAVSDETRSWPGGQYRCLFIMFHGPKIKKRVVS